MIKHALFGGALLASTLLLSCKKEVEVIKIQETEKQYSWAEVPFLGSFKILLGIGRGPNALYFQQPGGFCALRYQQNSPDITQYIYPFSTDISLRVPLGPDFFATYRDTLLAVTPNAYPVLSGASNYLYLKRLDKQALRVQRNYFTFAKFGAINRNNYLLFPYETMAGTADGQLHLVLTEVQPSADPFTHQPSLRPKVIRIPFKDIGIYPSFPTLVTAIDDYFLVDCGNEGLYKIKQDGSWRQVLSTWTGAQTIYKWNNRVYMHGAKLGYSTTDGETWVFSGNTPSGLQFNSMHPVGDSLVGVFHGFGNNFIFTLKLTDTNFRLRPLKDDGLQRADITGLEALGDTVFVATTGGLFKRSKAKFFESK
ncbi:hypothetical protein [Hymenobacter persicinus]|uniref:DUF4221 domain-containing protein n=1 Tax=Hymenobacter persicinus TaxID=2025506 RepID=A0A4Q5LFF9_9BACT|nr:hypothetical protein [Hymenobacter persicinus]RYU81555.1 hypothetical protein EWM57_06040 [Hymenobacter persicinus]